MLRTLGKYLFLLIGVTPVSLSLFAQNQKVTKFVNPWIGTSNTQTNSLWGSEGGTYPGAVAPFGFVQLTPETRNSDSKGYNYTDNSIHFFSCINHPTGYPDGSSGMIRLMPVEEGAAIQGDKYCRTFLHKDEEAFPGYYSVLFRDNGTKVEVSAAVHTGIFRFTFPADVKPRIFLSDLGKIETISKRMLSGARCHAIISFNADYNDMQEVPGGCILNFSATKQDKNILILKIGVSLVDFESTLNNLRIETDSIDFDKFTLMNRKKWDQALSVIEVDDSSRINKTIFYTALYHSMLMPWVISDVFGKYMGADGSVHQAKGKNQYGGFSAWDTFRSLHPLLCLVAPDRQLDMIHSMLDNFKQCGSLPAGPMTGNHIIPIIVDSYLKGINGFDKGLAFKAMKSCLASASASIDFSAYKQLGYVPAFCSESVTKTVEFAYDDWALAQFAGKVMNDPEISTNLMERSLNYQNLFSHEVLALLPRKGNTFNTDPANIGYKEGDQWSYSMFVPHNPQDLVNLFGGDTEFAAHLDSALAKQYILFDNEPVLHVPYLFNYANRPDITQKWVRKLMKTHYTNSPFGLPGNDDHGALSSWYVFSAMGLYPTCPGKPLYDIGSPLFKKVTLNLLNGKKWTIQSINNGPYNLYIQNTRLNSKVYNKSWISHSIIEQGGEVTYEMDRAPVLKPHYIDHFEDPSDKKTMPDFQLSAFYPKQKQVVPDQLLYIRFMILNRGSKGTKIVRLFVDGKEYGKKNFLMDENSVVADSIGCRLYPLGVRMIRIDQLKENPVEVMKPTAKTPPLLKVLDLKSNSIIGNTLPIEYSFMIQNKSGIKMSQIIPVSLDDSIFHEAVVILEPGELKTINKSLIVKRDGIHKLRVGSKVIQFKRYSKNTDSKTIDINFNISVKSDTIVDRSGLWNHALLHQKPDDTSHLIQGIQTDSVRFAEFTRAESLDNLRDKITVMAWVKPSSGNGRLSDIITKGDFIALQASGNKSLSWFAGGWGRGSCSAELSDNWINNWHHIAGVADGNYLRLYIDGVESGHVTIDKPANLSSHAKWMIGRNEEFPDQRFFNGIVDHFKIFVEPLTEAEIKEEMKKGEMQ